MTKQQESRNAIKRLESTLDRLGVPLDSRYTADAITITVYVGDIHEPADKYILDSAPTARRSDPESSHVAAATLTETEIEGLFAVVLSSLREWGSGTQLETAERTGIGVQTISPRFVQMERRGLIRKIGKKPNHRGTMVGVYEAVA